MTDAQYHGCRGAEEMHEEFQTVLREHLARYPLMEPQDCAKLAYQSTFGQPMQRGNGEMSSGSCWGSAAPFPQTGRPGRRSGSGTVCAAFICRGRGIGRWLRRSWRICCF